MIKIERDLGPMQYVVRIDREDLERAFTSQSEYNALIVKISKLIYEAGKGRIL